MEALAQAGGEEVHAAVAEVMAEEAAALPPLAREAVKAYLEQLPAAVRRTLRRPSDPFGLTATPMLVPRSADDVLRLLPPRMPRFRAGDRPLEGVDLVLEMLLGIGGFGEVWKARNPHLRSADPVAIKFPLDARAEEALRNEAQMLDRVMRFGRHPGIVQLQRTYFSAKIPCLEYEFVEGGDLASLIQEWHRPADDMNPDAAGNKIIISQAGSLTGLGPVPRLAGEAMEEICRTLGFTHRLADPIVHGDLKPANFLVRPANSTGNSTGNSAGHSTDPRYRVLDYGIGRVASRRALHPHSGGTTRGAFLATALRGACTPLYASPQQMRGDDPDVRDDVFSLGVIWHQMLTGDLGYGAPLGNRWQRKLEEQGVPARQIELLASCFERDPDDRPADALVLAEALAKTLVPSRRVVSPVPASPGVSSPAQRVITPPPLPPRQAASPPAAEPPRPASLAEAMKLRHAQEEQERRLAEQRQREAEKHKRGRSSFLIDASFVFR